MAVQEVVTGYRRLNTIREGRTCFVWEVINDATNQRRAVKVLTPEAAHNREEIAFLKHEYEVGRGLKHPNVIEIYEFGTKGDYVYLLMELFPAPNIKQTINQGVEVIHPMVGDVIKRAAQGLSYFHKQNWVHRDIKPDNFLMNSKGEVKLIDFALAVRPKGALGRLFAARTKVQGTRSYMSPEQIRGEPLDQRADIYSFGCMMHELVGGKPPFTGSSTNDLLNKHLKSPIPPVQASNPNATEDFANLVKRMLAKKPSDRPASMDDVLAAMHSISVFKTPPRVPQK